jgi:hypothetical protein
MKAPNSETKSIIDGLVARLYIEVKNLAEAHREKRENVVRRCSRTILELKAKLESYEEPSLEGVIKKALGCSDIRNLPPDLYRSVCWHCYRVNGTVVDLTINTHKRCEVCNWFICDLCDSCIAPEQGRCIRKN